MSEYVHNIFNTPIWGYILSSHQYQSKDYLDRLFEIEQTEQSAKKSNFGGFQTRDNLNDTEGVLKELVNYINNIANDIAKEYTNKKIGITEMWGNINYKYSSNGAHTHSGIFSGVFYLQTPENCGNLVFCNPAVRSDGHLIRAKNYSIKPQALACIMFPSWLEHYVEANLSDSKRVSLSFNIG